MESFRPLSRFKKGIRSRKECTFLPPLLYKSNLSDSLSPPKPMFAELQSSSQVKVFIKAHQAATQSKSHSIQFFQSTMCPNETQVTFRAPFFRHWPSITVPDQSTEIHCVLKILVSDAHIQLPLFPNLTLMYSPALQFRLYLSVTEFLGLYLG